MKALKPLFLSFSLIATTLFAQDTSLDPFIFKYSTEELRQNYSKIQEERAQRAIREMDSVIFHGKYKEDFASLYEHPTPEWFKDANFGIELNIGFYSATGVGIRGKAGNYYNDQYTDHMYTALKDYHLEKYGDNVEKDDFIPLFTNKSLDAKKSMELFKKAGAKYFVMYTSHRSTGMLLWDSEHSFRNSVQMPPFRDLTAEFGEAAKEFGLPYGVYLNLEDSEYPIIDKRENEQLKIRKWTVFETNSYPDNGSYEDLIPYDKEAYERRIQGKIPVHDYVEDYLLPFSKELIDKYDPQYIWFDGGWKRPAWYYQSMKTVAYFYNKNEGRQDVLVNCRLGYDYYGILGDVAVSEGGSLDAGRVKIDLNEVPYWEENTPVGRNFGYDKAEDEGEIKVPGAEDLLKMLIRIVAKGGNLLLIVTPDSEGRIPEYQINILEELGEWLSLNGESIYNTRTHPHFANETRFGRTAYYTRSKNGKFTYAINTRFHTDAIVFHNINAKEGTEVKLIGHDEPLEWSNSRTGLIVIVPYELQENLPCDHAWVFKIEEENIKESNERVLIE
ncbi:MAG: alpha-L-fucosidase [Bacteroidota bacterium]